MRSQIPDSPADRPDEQLTVEAERVAHRQRRPLRDPPARSTKRAVEHVLIELGAGGVFARALSFEPPPTINNIPFTQAPLAAGRRCSASARCRCSSRSPATRSRAAASVEKKGQDEPDARHRGDGGRMPRRVACSSAATTTSGESSRRGVPELWDQAAATCPTAARTRRSPSREKRMRRRRKRERRPFHVQDGVEAVPLYETRRGLLRRGRRHEQRRRRARHRRTRSARRSTTTTAPTACGSSTRSRSRTTQDRAEGGPGAPPDAPRARQATT